MSWALGRNEMRRKMTRLSRVAVAVMAMLVAYIAIAQRPEPTTKTRELSLENKPWKGDFEQMLARREIRVLLPYSRTLFFVDKGRERGVSAEVLRDFEHYVNRKYAKQLGKRPLTVYLIATTRDKLLSGVADGLGDMAAGNLTVTDERLKVVDFVAPRNRQPIRELVVTGPNSPAVSGLDDLSGKPFHVRPSSSYYQSLVALNSRLQAAGKAPAKIITLPDELEDEDVLEMLNAGLFEFVVVDDWKAKTWAEVLPKVKVRADLVLRGEGYIGWAIRKDSPELAAAVLDYYQNVLEKQGGFDASRAKFQKSIRRISNNTGSAEWKRFEQTIKLFEKYGAQYGFDPLMLAAQGYQESQLNQNAKSQAGAIGVMQIMPALGSELGVGSIYQIEPNIHGGAKYMDQLMTQYFPDAKFSEEVRPLFAFASYNAGPANIARMRTEASRRGLDPDKWFNNVEIVVSEKIGLETTTYVRNIYKYYTAYKLTLQAQQAQQAARDKVKK
jgi:membrane-bound lytic murein transglycosylase MltF